MLMRRTPHHSQLTHLNQFLRSIPIREVLQTIATHHKVKVGIWMLVLHNPHHIVRIMRAGPVNINPRQHKTWVACGCQREHC
jgi:hypothetical protein